MLEILIGLRDTDPLLYEKIVNPDKFKKKSEEPPPFAPPPPDITPEAHITREGLD
jgi:hypothetical protein